MSVLRKSCGNIDQYADVVAIIHRPEFYKIWASEDAVKGIAELIVCKNEWGKTDMLLMGFDRSSLRFFNYNNDIENHLKGVENEKN